MTLQDYIFTSESVSEGHPDKVCDQISDAILDEHLKGDNRSRVALESLVTTDLIVLSGEITSKTKVDYEKIARGVVADIGVASRAYGAHRKRRRVLLASHAHLSGAFDHEIDLFLLLVVPRNLSAFRLQGDETDAEIRAFDRRGPAHQVLRSSPGRISSTFNVLQIHDTHR